MIGNRRRWMGVVEEWEPGDGQGDVPPGMGEPGPEVRKARLYPNTPSDLR